MSEFNPFTGQWSYRSFRNNPDLGVEPNDLLFGAGNLVLEETAPGEGVAELWICYSLVEEETHQAE